MMEIRELEKLDFTTNKRDLQYGLDNYRELKKAFSERVLEELEAVEVKLDMEIKIANLKMISAESEEKRAEIRYELERCRERAEAEQFELIKMLHDEKRRRANNKRLEVMYGQSISDQRD